MRTAPVRPLRRNARRRQHPGLRGHDGRHEFRREGHIRRDALETCAIRRHRFEPRHEDIEQAFAQALLGFAPFGLAQHLVVDEARKGPQKSGFRGHVLRQVRQRQTGLVGNVEQRDVMPGALLGQPQRGGHGRVQGVSTYRSRLTSSITGLGSAARHQGRNCAWKSRSTCRSLAGSCACSTFQRVLEIVHAAMHDLARRRIDDREIGNRPGLRVARPTAPATGPPPRCRWRCGRACRLPRHSWRCGYG